MSGKFMNINGPITADTIYVNNKLAARDVAITLPEVTATAVDVQAMGTMSLPIWSMLDNMELAMTKIGIDMGLRDMITPDSQNYEARFVQTVTDANGNTTTVGCKAFIKGNGNTTTVGCKAFIKGIANKIPGIAVTMGEASENEATVTVTRYQLMVGGQEMFLIDRLAGICRIGGKDYANVDNLL